MGKCRIASLAEVPEGGNRAFAVGGKSVLLCRTSSGVFATENMCSHAFSYLEGGKMKGPYLFCPLHGVRFDLRSGTPSGNLTKRSIPVYPVSVEGTDVFAELPDD
jgi:3-phenylpropionate/trans-cinnamate dioxygenase ferredoxin subunit